VWIVAEKLDDSEVDVSCGHLRMNVVFELMRIIIWKKGGI